jgi:ribosomal protein L11 methyltransferase
MTMTWMQLSADTTDEAIDWIRTLLAEINYSGTLRIFDHGDSLNDSAIHPSEWTRTVQLLLSDKASSHSEIQHIKQHLSSLQRTGMMADWQVRAIAELPPDPTTASTHTIGRFVILASNSTETVTPPHIPLIVGHTLAFGSGFHPATILCMRLLEQYIQPGMKTLDLGCGSGILSVAMAKLGATVTAIDNDAIAVKATQTTLQQNDVTDQVTPFVGSLGHGSNLGHWMGGQLDSDIQTVRPDANFDLIVANVFARIHLSLIDDYYHALKSSHDRGGLLITAGYDTDYEQEITATFQRAGFQAIACERLGNWLAFAHQQCA